MQIEPNESNHMIVETLTEKDRKESELTYEDLALLCDLFYLPFEHGAQGLQLLQEFQWLKSNAHIVISANQRKDHSNPELEEWFARAEKMNEMSEAVNRLLLHMTACNNRELLYDLYSYIWDIRGVISLLNSYIKWLGIFPYYWTDYSCLFLS
ncbi:protein O-GlcNAcase-like isoform X2 [Dendroctonus ponderosae]|uniref:protein O-GlcNAcase-like isoform X2 n=1 Tax=Dendroctonus ponderosae TaxID=77166 RepID=UPI002035EB07|nr:protein O-GlcNAcase-like isoform X2 [Dendroctonus ponderosae]